MGRLRSAGDPQRRSLPLRLWICLPLSLLSACGPTDSVDADEGQADADSLDFGAVADELIERAEDDQRYRTIDYASLDDSTRTRTFAEAIAVDSANAVWIKELVTAVGWPDSRRFGEEAAHAAWVLVQHADRDPAFQAKMLPLAEAAARRGEASWLEVAYLNDRVRIRAGRPQLYGTQYETENWPDGSAKVDESGGLIYLPPVVEDPPRLDERRAAVGLGPWDEYERRMARLQQREPFDGPRYPRDSIP